MKKISIGLILLLSFCNSIHSQDKDWKKVDTRPDYSTKMTYSSYRSIKCFDSLNCMIYGALYGAGGYYFRRTTDGGDSWNTIFSDSAYFIDFGNEYWVPDLHDIAYPSRKIFIAVGDSGLIVRTADSGKTWHKSTYIKNCYLFRIRMFDENYGIIEGCKRPCNNDSDGFYLETIDGGETWNKMIRPPGISFAEFEIVNRNLICGLTWLTTPDSLRKEYIIWVHDGWKSFDTVPKPTYGFHFDFINEKKGWISGGKKILYQGFNVWTQVIYHTSDGGKTFDIQRDTMYNGVPIDDIKFYDENFGIGASEVSHVVMTDNGGKNWRNVKIAYTKPNDGYSYIVLSIQIPSYTTAYVILEYDYIYKYTRDWTDVVEEKIDTDFEVSPNPATDFIEIKQVTTKPIAIYSVLGIKLIESEYKEKIDVSGLAPGMYFVRIGDKVSKFIKI